MTPPAPRSELDRPPGRPFHVPAPRPEAAGDADAIRALTAAAFDGRPFSDGTEPAIVDRLRADGDLTLSLVVEVGAAIVGHVAASPMRRPSPGWAGLGPVSVRPGLQRRGIGSALILDVLRRLREAGWAGCLLVGDPAYYARLGFRGGAGLRYGGLDPAFVQGIAFGGAVPAGTIRFAAGFGD